MQSAGWLFFIDSKGSISDWFTLSYYYCH